MQINNLDLRWLGHSCFFIKNLKDNKVLYIDPYNLREDLEKADIIFITHSHYDHCSVEDLNKVVKPGTMIFMSADSQSKITRLKVDIKMHIIEPNKEFSLGNLRISTIPSYNIDKPFHPKEEGWLGYILKFDDTIIYHAGDTDLIPEFQKLTGHKSNIKEFIALLPVGGRFTMTAEEAAEAARIIKPTLAIPMHYGSVAGSEEDAKEFVSLCNEFGINAEILERS